MANFDEAFNITMGHEGKYSNDPTDAGGETYCGIARRYNPQWDGWNIIDDTKPNINSDQLEPYVRKFYETRYWDVNLLDDFSQNVANEIFDTSVNQGVHQASKYLQQALNYLNRNEKNFNDLLVDGVVGSVTFKALNYVVEHGDEDILITIMNILQGQHYLDYMKKSPIQEKYCRGWLKRVAL